MGYHCSVCNKNFNNINGLSKHLILSHEIKLLDYYVKYNNFEIPKCPYCDNNTKQRTGLNFNKTCGNKKCIKIDHSNRKLSHKTKLKISKSLKTSHKNGNHPGWSFINSDVNRRSYPEKYFVNILKKYNLYSKYTIQEKLSFGKYFLDFAFLDIKTDVEIDGQQHFNTKNAIDHDIKRDGFLLKNNWKVYRISWMELKNNPKLVIEKFLNWLETNERLYHKYDINEVLKSIKKEPNIYGTSNEYHNHIKNELILKNKPKVELILNSNIDFLKYGWVKDVSELANIKYQKVNKWMKLYMIDFYETKCFKRN
jgi:very-short-patch-repair endonuclease